MAENIESVIDLRAAQTAPAVAAKIPEPQAQRAPHLIGLEDSTWALWHWAVLRGAGFPASRPLDLSTPACALASDKIIEDEEAAMVAQGLAVDALQRDMQAAGDREHGIIKKAIRRLRKNSTADLQGIECSAAPALETFYAARARVDKAQSAFQEAYKTAADQTTTAVREVAGDRLFHEAIIWQNRTAFHTGIKQLLDTPENESARIREYRRHEELAASYLQRYCLKNDTIGFFGPVGWAKLVTEGPALICRPGPNLLATRHVYFENWCIDALTKTLGANRALKPWVAPRRSPLIRCEGTTVFLPLRPPISLSPQQSVVLQGCDGERTPRRLASHLCQTFPQLLRSNEEIYGILEGLSARGLISWTLEVPVATDSERLLRNLIAKIEPDALRRSALEPLEQLEAARDAVAAAIGDAEKLDQSLGELESTFTRLTTVAATRSAGKMYAGRTLVYEDCRRNAEVLVGPALIQSLGAPLSLLLTSARWFTYQVAAVYREAFKRIYAELCRKLKTRQVDGVSFIIPTQALLAGDQSRLSGAVLADFQQRWAKVLSLPSGQRRVHYRSEHLRARVLAAFDAPRPGWSLARYHSPDIMICASSVAAVERGEYQFVLGELHLGGNTLRPALFIEQHPAPEEILRALDLDIPEPRLEPIWSHSMDKVTSRDIVGLISPKDYRLALAPDAFGAPPERTVPIGSLILEQRGNELIVRTRDGRLQYEVIDAIGDLMTGRTTSLFKIFAPQPHSPRVTIDQFVIARESWSFRATEIEFAFEKDEARRFVAARRWARKLGMPRFVFVKSKIETKPFYVDFSSLVYLNIFAKVVRRTARTTDEMAITISEMLPTADQCWLEDNEGRHYTSELRIVALDTKTSRA